MGADPGGGLTEKEGDSLTPTPAASCAQPVRAGALDANLPENRLGHLPPAEARRLGRRAAAQGLASRAGLLFLVQNSFHPQSPHCPSWNREAPAHG